MKVPNVTTLRTERCELAENPLWDTVTGRLYWTDIPTGRVFEFDPESGVQRLIYEGEPVGGFTFQAGGGLLLFRSGDIATLGLDGKVQSLRKFSEDGMERFNDVIADPVGRVFAGTYGENPKCGLYRVDLDGTITKLFSGTGCSNGMGFSPDRKTFYWTCSTTCRIYQFDYDLERGELRNRRTFYETESTEGLPDGLCVDVEGCVWSARWGGAAVLRHAPTGKILERVSLPAANITSLCFGGKKLDQLYITSAREPGVPDEGGHLFQISVEVPGPSEFTSRLKINNP